jgi:class 3 adenylate cyclase
MTALRLTAIMKTDIAGSTPRFRALGQADFAAFLAEHRTFVSRLVAAQGGSIVKGEGDGFWIAFPSVTAAALAALAIQEELWRAQSNAGDDRVALRIVITLGDVLCEKGDFFGEAVTLAARIEGITPEDEIYMSAAARLAVNQAEIRSAIVDTYALKGFAEPVPVYRVEQTHRTQFVTGQYIVWTDLRGFGRFFSGTAPIMEAERVLDTLLALVGEVCQDFDGVNRFSSGDTHCQTYTEPDPAMAASERLVEGLDLFDRAKHVNCPMVAALHKGSLYLFRSYAYSQDLNIAAGIVDADRLRAGRSILVTGPVQQELAGTAWSPRLQRVDIGPGRRGHLAGIEVFRLDLC